MNRTPALRGAWPWMAMLHRTPRGPFCGGTLLGDQWVLTAAHCLVSPTTLAPVLKDSFSVKLGKHRARDKDTSEQTAKVADIIVHPSFNFSTFLADIGLLKLESPARLNPYVTPICLLGEEEATATLVPDREGVVTGWGHTDQGFIANELRQVFLPLVNTDICNKTYDFTVTADMVCAGFQEGGKDACRGDSGGPLAFFDRSAEKWVQGGVVSWGWGCGRKNKYGVYTNVEHYLQWIKEVMSVVV